MPKTAKLHYLTKEVSHYDVEGRPHKDKYTEWVVLCGQKTTNTTKNMNKVNCSKCLTRIEQLREQSDA